MGNVPPEPATCTTIRITARALPTSPKETVRVYMSSEYVSAVQTAMSTNSPGSTH